MRKVFVLLAVLLLAAQLACAKKLYVEMEYKKNSIKLDDGTLYVSSRMGISRYEICYHWGRICRRIWRSKLNQYNSILHFLQGSS